MGYKFVWVALALAVGLGSPARAAWHEASSERFVIYADDSEQDVRRFAEMLERYHAAMELLTGREVPPPSPSNRVTIYAVGGSSDMRKLSGSRTIAGFYVARAGRSAAFVPDVRISSRELDFSMVVLLHEYAHHFFISSTRFSMPHWLSEGAAEFFASARFPDDDGVEIGLPAVHRAGELFLAARIPAERLLALGPDADGADAFYGRSWLLYHLLTFDTDRKGQLAEYWRMVAGGTPSLEAGRAAFGDLDKLDRDLRSYLNQRKMLKWEIPPAALPIGPIAVRRVSEGMGKMLPVIIVSRRGVDHEQALELLPQARAVAARYLDDPGVLAALAEAEFDAGNDGAAIVAADRALALDPASENALVHKGYALFRMAETADDPATAYSEAMAPFRALNSSENDHPLPLIQLYYSYVRQGLEPTETARHALERAAQLAPFDYGLWMSVALMQIQEGKISIARDTLAPIAANPHSGSLATAASKLIGSLATAAEGQPLDGQALISAAMAEAPALQAPE